ncbi:MAG: hypothetical protein ACK5KN_01685 [Dysgonomonas sp.]|uniref:hypothetical protein n=1 Tax=Dysgonomonas sp. TaxID=1891233 RepID=UPI003A83BF67
MRRNYYFLFLALSMIMLSCGSGNEDETVIYKTVDINMIDLGKISTDLSFDISQGISSDIHSCCLRTKLIRSGDVIDTIMVASAGKDLKISIITSPNDFTCSESSCFTVHELKFNIVGLKKGKYNIDLGINNGYGKPFEFIIN